jgi:D-xylose transport system ATP-binding protein
VFSADTSHEDLVAAITGAAENSVTRRQKSRAERDAGATP